MKRLPLDSLGLLIFRVGVGGMLFFGHGLRKIVHYGTMAATFSDPIGLGPHVSLALVAFAEGICSILVALGVRARWAAIPLIINFVVAGFVAHAGAPFARHELALMYLAAYVLIALVGPGRYTLDRVLRRPGA